MKEMIIYILRGKHNYEREQVTMEKIKKITERTGYHGKDQEDYQYIGQVLPSERKKKKTG